MKKKFAAIICVFLALALAVSLTACGEGDPFKKADRAFAAAIEAADSLDNPKESDLAAGNVEANAETEEEDGIALLSAFAATPMGVLDTAEKVQRVLDSLQYIKTRQIELDGYKSSIKVEVATFRAGVKSYRDLKLSLTAEEKTAVLAYVDEIKELSDAIKGTIGKVYAVLRDAKSLYRLKTIDEAITVLDGVVAKMDIRTDSAKRLYAISTEINAMLEAKIAAGA